MNVVFLGTNNVGFDIYRWLCDRASVTVHALLTTRDQLSLIPKLEPDAVVASGYPHVVPPRILAVPDEGCINVHPGLLPQTRGYNPNVWSIVEDLPAGATVHYMDEEIDSGDVIARREVDVSFDDTGKHLYERIETACFDLFTETWPAIERGEVEPTSQDDSVATYHEKGDFADLCELDPEERYTVRELLDRLRALTFPPFDNAYVDIDGERYYVDVSITHEDDASDEHSAGLLDAY